MKRKRPSQDNDKKTDSLRAVDLLVEALKDLKRQGRLMAWKGQVIIQVPLFRIGSGGELIRLNRLRSVWQGWRRRRTT
jgi:hypothetical protein